MRLHGKFSASHAIYPKVVCPRCKVEAEYRISLREQPDVLCGANCGQRFTLGFDSEKQQPFMEAAAKPDRSGGDAP